MYLFHNLSGAFKRKTNISDNKQNKQKQTYFDKILNYFLNIEFTVLIVICFHCYFFLDSFTIVKYTTCKELLCTPHCGHSRKDGTVTLFLFTIYYFCHIFS